MGNREFPGFKLFSIVIKIMYMKLYINKPEKPFLHYIDLSKHIAHHLVGPNHSITHRRGIGIIVMSAGILLTKIVFFQHCLIANMIQDIVGTSIHGIGLIPFVKEIEKNVENIKL